MAFAAVLTALGYYIILRRFCQGLLKIFLQGAATGGSFPSLPPATPAFGVLPCPPPAGDGSGRSSRRPKPPRLSRVPLTPAEPARQGKPLRQRAIRPCSGAARVQPREITLVSPFPAGEGGRGDRGQENRLQAGATGNQKGTPPSGPTAAGRASAAGAKPPLSFPQRQG